VTKKRVWHNAAKANDVNGDGLIVAADALEVINFINAFKPQGVPTDGRAAGPYYDVTGDGFVAAADALEVINHINAFGPESEGESAHDSVPYFVASPARPVAATASMTDLISLLAADASAARRRK
jgi:hypothetical protein